MVVTLRIANYDIRRVLIDNGSVVNVIFLLTLTKMEFDLRRIEPTKNSLTGFSGEVKVLEGWITFPITVGEKSNYIISMDEFQLIDSFFLYNGFMISRLSTHRITSV